MSSPASGLGHHDDDRVFHLLDDLDFQIEAGRIAELLATTTTGSASSLAR